jgi:hypothetical protein
MIALVIAESEYPCGNVFGVYDTRDKAMEDLHKKFPNQMEEVDGVLFIRFDKERVDVKFIEFELNTFIQDSLTKCTGCMSLVRS